ncbi:hypothetical protein B0O80DRAFT_426806 [Mortierella sp. GBAus27b]|nr:Mitochondrial copper homeostasis protein [Mortierella sp. GBA43]KAI8353393.1 hypothetical protein B0O80DRAFT_426806 [Mortierella sp. GBAus27b]
MADSTPRPNVTRGNNTTVSSASLKAEKEGNSSSSPPPPRRGPRKLHEHIRTSEEEMKDFNKTFYVKEKTQYLDPCREQTKASLRCMDENNYDKRRCTRFFKDYSDCKKQWMATLREDRRKKNLGIVDDDDSGTPTTAGAATSQDSKSSTTSTPASS